MNRKQYFGIKFPFTVDNLQGLFIDLNGNVEEKVASEILHVLLTPKRQRIRMPEFGTNLIKYIFEPSDELSWSDIQSEAKDAVLKFVPNANLYSIEIYRDENDENGVFLNMEYGVKKGNTVVNNQIAIKL